MKKMTAIVIAFILALSLCACESSSSGSSGSSEPETEAEEISIVGKWKMTGYEFRESYKSAESMVKKIDYSGEFKSDDTFLLTVTIDMDYNGQSQKGTVEYNGTYSIDEKNITCVTKNAKSTVNGQLSTLTKEITTKGHIEDENKIVFDQLNPESVIKTVTMTRK